MDNKPKTSPSMLKAINTYNKKSKYIQLKFTQNSVDEYQRIVNYTDSNKMSMQRYIKELIKADLDSKGIPYPKADKDVDM